MTSKVKRLLVTYQVRSDGARPLRIVYQYDIYVVMCSYCSLGSDVHAETTRLRYVIMISQQHVLVGTPRSNRGPPQYAYLHHMVSPDINRYMGEQNNGLSELPVGLFDGLTKLRTL